MCTVSGTGAWTFSNGSGTTTGDVWQFRVPLEAPTNNSTDVSVYCKFEWEASADYTSGVATEGIYISTRISQSTGTRLVQRHDHDGPNPI